MGLIYSQQALFTIVGAHNDKGISYEEVLEINNKTFRSKIENHWGYFEPNSNNHSFNLIEKRNGLYFLDPKFKKTNESNISDWKSLLKEMLVENEKNSGND